MPIRLVISLFSLTIASTLLTGCWQTQPHQSTLNLPSFNRPALSFMPWRALSFFSTGSRKGLDATPVGGKSPMHTAPQAYVTPADQMMGSMPETTPSQYNQRAQNQQIAQQDDIQPTAAPIHFEPHAVTPEVALRQLFQALAGQQRQSDLPFYNQASRDYLAAHPWRQAQMRYLLKRYQQCSIDKVLINQDRAVILYRSGQYQCTPWLFEHNQGWKIDLASYRQNFTLDKQNHWRFQSQIPAPYAFAFHDYSLDQHGYLVVPRWGIYTQGRMPIQITELAPSFPLAQMGLRMTDQPIAINGQLIEDDPHFHLLLNQLLPQQAIEIEVIRQGQRAFVNGVAPAWSHRY
ncbi:hypothetical protein VST7929_00295 [Vibrio stylophorae]|uniref:PDZ domain-containing protein n=1 Tax=Vibrio stylophorae TaxID=659351 RepID=A0ABM8ZQ87_9VIBR|nr:hypothetical protein [Vibrio stylophorae]CAH0532466.1 hypothetical protein VST7929_00295 [Vibrio stylophorae]